MWENAFNLLNNDELQANVHWLPGSGVSPLTKNQTETKQTGHQPPPPKNWNKRLMICLCSHMKNKHLYFLPTLFHFFQIKFKSVQSILLQYIFCKNQGLKESQYFNKQYSRPR